MTMNLGCLATSFGYNSCHFFLHLKHPHRRYSQDGLSLHSPVTMLCLDFNGTGDADTYEYYHAVTHQQPIGWSVSQRAK